jgi:hypothetical protein
VRKIGFVLSLVLLLVFPVLSQTSLQRGELIRATYGSGSQWVDVTPQVRSLIRGESLSFRVDNTTLGVERRSGTTKALRLQFRGKNGRTQQLTFQQNQYVNLRVNSVAGLDQTTTPTWGRSNTPDNGACFYRNGFNGDAFCLQTGQSLSSMPNGMNDQISAIKLFGNATATVFRDSGFGGERQTFSSNVADLRYGSGANWGDRISSIRVDRASSTTADNGNGYRDGLQITRAIYGAGSRTWDVTSRLNSQIQNRALNFQVNNESMGGDPSPNQKKTLTVQYTYNGAVLQSIVSEGNYLRLPTDHSYSNNNNGYFNDRNLHITRAQYGNGNRMADVTDRLNSEVRNGQLNMKVTNDTMGSDPSPNRNKTLTVQYVYNGALGQVVINEGDSFNLPAEYSPSASETIRCESNNNGRNYCPVNTRGGVRLSRQISGSPCTQGSTWGYESNRIWVDNGCRADFRVSSQFGRDVSSTPNGTYMTIPNGTELAIRTNETIDSSTSTEGQRFSAVMYSDVQDNSGAVAIPRGSDVGLIIRSTAGSDLVLDIDSLVVAGQRYVISTTDLQKEGRDGIGANRRTAEMVGGGAAVGAIIGAVVGGGKGAAIGAAIGAAGGAGAQVLTKGKQVRVPSETILNFKLDSDLRMQSSI